MVPVNGPHSTQEFCRIIRSKEDGSLLSSSWHQFVQFFRQILQVSDYFEETRAAFLTSSRWLSVFVFALLFLCVSLSGLLLNVIAFVCLYLFVYLSFLCEKYMKEKCLDFEVSLKKFPVRFSWKISSSWERRSRAPRDYDSLPTPIWECTLLHELRSA